MNLAYNEKHWYFIWGKGWHLKGVEPVTCHLVDTLGSEFAAVYQEVKWKEQTNFMSIKKSRYPDGRHNGGMHYSTMLTILPPHLYLPEVVKVTHFKIGPRNIYCLIRYRSSRKYKGYYKRSFKLFNHHEGHCPGCIPNRKLLKRPPKLNRRTTLLRREKA